MNCYNCGKENNIDNKFCFNCGVNLEQKTKQESSNKLKIVKILNIVSSILWFMAALFYFFPNIVIDNMIGKILIFYMCLILGVGVLDIIVNTNNNLSFMKKMIITDICISSVFSPINLIISIIRLVLINKICKENK